MIAFRYRTIGYAAAFFFVGLEYAFATDLLSGDWAILAVCACYIPDQTLSSVSIARNQAKGL